MNTTQTTDNVIYLSERRRLPRKPVDFEVQLHQGQLLIVGRATDYSVLGMRFRPETATDGDSFLFGESALDELDPEQPVTVVIYSRQRAVCEWQACVRWSANGLCGLENTALSTTAVAA